MLVSPALIASIAVFVVGAVIFWSNTARIVNRVVFTCSTHIAFWLACSYLATTSERGSEAGLFWLRMSCAVGASIPMHFWIVKETIAGRTRVVRRWFYDERLIWIVVSVLLTFICFTEVFIPSHSTATQRVRGWGYTTYIATCFVLYIYLTFDSLKAIRSLIGSRRIELQVWLLGGCSIGTLVVVLMALRTVTHDSRYLGLQPLGILVFYAATAVAITTHRIFDARQILFVAVQKLSLVVVVTMFAYLVDYVLEQVLPEPVAFVLTTASALSLAAAMHAWLNRVFHFYPQATAARQAAFLAAQRETKLDKLQSSFSSVLKGWGQTDHAVVISGTQDALSGGGIELRGDGTVMRALRQLRWVTPERLARERSTPERRELNEFLHREQLAVLVMVEGPSLTALVGVGVGASRRPVTYPQVTQLMELAAIMEGALERAHFSAKVQHTEQLATVGLLGASVAHEIRNPLVSIKTFVQLLPTHHHDPAFRDKFFRLIGDEVGRIDQLTEQLLDLASPRTYTAEEIELHPVLRASLDLVAAKAAHRQVQFFTDFGATPDIAFTDASAAKQVMLNLCFNAIQAVESRNGSDRWVKIATRNTGNGIEMAVADSGPGISEEIRPRLFQPFQTTKSTGFGLGLAICSDILTSLNARISVDPPAEGCGATFRVTFPCQPS